MPGYNLYLLHSLASVPQVFKSRFLLELYFGSNFLLLGLLRVWPIDNKLLHHTLFDLLLVCLLENYWLPELIWN